MSKVILESVMEAGRQFQIVGAATEKALQAVTDFLAKTVGTDSLFIDDERRDLDG